MSSLYSFLIATSVISGLVLSIMVLLQQTSNSGIISNSTSHFAPGSLDAFKNKVIMIIAVFFISNILLLWVVRNKIATEQNKSIVSEVALESEKADQKETPVK